MVVRDFIRFSFDILTWLIIIRALLSWVPQIRGNRLFLMLADVTETFIAPVRRILPRNYSGVDFAPLVTIIVIRLLQALILSVM